VAAELAVSQEGFSSMKLDSEPLPFGAHRPSDRQSGCTEHTAIRLSARTLRLKLQ
jgi:hypothetical protein